MARWSFLYRTKSKMTKMTFFFKKKDLSAKIFFKKSMLHSHIYISWKFWVNILKNGGLSPKTKRKKFFFAVFLKKSHFGREEKNIFFRQKLSTTRTNIAYKFQVTTSIIDRELNAWKWKKRFFGEMVQFDRVKIDLEVWNFLSE